MSARIRRSGRRLLCWWAIPVKRCARSRRGRGGWGPPGAGFPAPCFPSGGGFRASLFHIGVLARLAELDVLRHVEVLSCVSGGSIIGAHYYLEVRRLLRKTPEKDIDRDTYITLVQELEGE